jgi:hypothetical protein
MNNTPFYSGVIALVDYGSEFPDRISTTGITAKNLSPDTWYGSSLRYIILRPTTICLTTGKAHVKQLGAYLHPVMQVLVLLMALATLRLGLALKKHRTRQRRLQEHRLLFARHVQLGLLFTGCLCAGYVLGILSMVFFRQQTPFRSAHFFFATLALGLFLGGAYAGWRLKQGTKKYADVRDLHSFLVYLGFFISLGVAVMGFILLP